MLDFLLADEPPTANPLPTLGDEENRIRVDPEEPIHKTGIYRDLWERKELSDDNEMDARSRDVWNKLEHPTSEDHCASRSRYFRRRRRLIRKRAEKLSEDEE